MNKALRNPSQDSVAAIGGGWAAGSGSGAALPSSLATQWRDSALTWFSDVPTNWTQPLLKVLATNVVEPNIDPDREIPYLGLQHIEGWTGRILATASSKEYSEQSKRFQSKDILFGKLRPYLAKVARPDFDGVCSGELLVLKPYTDLVDGEYLTYVLRSPSFIDLVTAQTQGARMPRAEWSTIGNIRIPLPPVEDQQRMVAFLTQCERQITRLIRNKRRLIALLNEEKQAIIQQAVTRGLDPDAQLKPSGTTAYGEVPSHWEVTKLHHLVEPSRKIMYGIVLPGPNVEDGVFIVKGGNCEPGRLTPEHLSKTTFEIERNYAQSRLRGGDIVFAIRGSIGAANQVPDELDGANLTQDAARISPRPGIDSRWLLHAVSAPAFFQKLDAGAVGATIRGINIRDLKRADIVLPPLREQVEIARFLDSTLARCNAALTTMNREINLIREYRSQLISDVVTGQLDVREVSASLPNIASKDFESNIDELLYEPDDGEELDNVDFALSENADAAD